MSIFTMEDVRKVLASGIDESKIYALSIINSAENVRPATVAKARQMIRNARTSHALAIAMSSWILAHPTEGLKVLQLT